MWCLTTYYELMLYTIFCVAWANIVWYVTFFMPPEKRAKVWRITKAIVFTTVLAFGLVVHLTCLWVMVMAAKSGNVDLMFLVP